jgi:cardiolipin synthase
MSLPDSMAETVLYLLALLVPLFAVLGIVSAIRAVMYTRTSQGAIAWATSLLFMPYLAVPLYWIFGRSRFHGYVRAHRAKRQEIRDVAEYVQTVMRQSQSPSDRPPEDHLAFENLTAHPFTGGNRIELLIDGEATFEAIFQAISAAQEYVLVEFFILRNDTVGTRLQEALVERARAGVRCHVLFDEVGSRSLSNSYVDSLRDAGVDIRPFSTTTGIRNLLQINFRNHRKIVVVDGRHGFIGGLNVGDEYLGADPDNSPWRDTHARLEGPIVLSAQMAFAEDWHWAAPDEELDLHWPADLEDPANMTALLVPSGPADDLETCGLMFVQAIHSADRRVWIATPYLVPDPPAIAALQLAALRGADVRILMPDNSDSILANWAAYTYYQELLPAGVKIYRYQPGFMHQKVMLVDDDLATVGTANFDNRSFRLNFEITALCSDPDFVRQVETMLMVDFASSRQVEPDEPDGWSFLFRFRCRLARLTASIQ